MIKLTNFQKRILKQNLVEIAAKNTERYFGDLVFAFEWIDNHEEFEEKTVIFISRKNGIELNYLDNNRIQSYLGWGKEGDQQVYTIDLFNLATIHDGWDSRDQAPAADKIGHYSYLRDEDDDRFCCIRKY